MKNILAVLFAVALVFSSVPAFACGPDKAAAPSGDDKIMTSVDDGDKEKAADAKKAKKDDKKDDDKKEAEEEKGEV